MVPGKRLTMGWEDDAWARGGVWLLSPLAGHGWTIWEMVSIALFVFFLLKIQGDCWQGAGLVKSSLLNCYSVGITRPGAT